VRASTPAAAATAAASETMRARERFMADLRW
jgi:hypothetical protein